MAQELQASAAQSPALPEAGSGPGRVLEELRRLGPGRILAIGLVLMALLAMLGLAARQMLQPRYTLLFAGLESGDLAAIVERLEAMEVPYRINAQGDAVLVPQGEVMRLRMALAEEGVAAGAVVGYELFDRANGFTVTDFVANVNLKRALEGELARTISSLRAVRRARVHIVLPERRLFAREQGQPTASVFLALGPGGELGRRQVEGIRHLVASAVAGLDPSRVTVVDEQGRLLARSDDSAAEVSVAEAESYRRALEQDLRAKIIALLERSLGPGRVEAQVTVELDFDERTVVEEIFDPNSQVARSTRTIEEARERQEAGEEGVTVGNNLPGAQPQAGPGSQERSERTEEIVNYEISRTVRNQRARGGRIRRLFVAVQVDGNWVDDGSGDLRFEPLAKEELAQLEALVRSAVGIDEERGDRIDVVSRPFQMPEAEPLPEPGWVERLLEDYGDLLESALWSLFGVAVLWFGFRPLLRRLLPPAERPLVAAGETVVVVGEDGTPKLLHTKSGTAVALDRDGEPVLARPKEPEPVAQGASAPQEGRSKEDAGEESSEPERAELVTLKQVEGKVRASMVNEVAEIIDRYPEEAIRVIRNWLYG